MLDNSFETIRFIRESPVVYAVGYKQRNAFVPVYIGETGHQLCRYADYVRASFHSSTDFNVGEALAYLLECGHEVLFKYKSSYRNKDERLREEKQIKQGLITSGVELLNEFPSYDYKTADKEVERQKIRQFVDRIVYKA